jgi:hypothetical protein
VTKAKTNSANAEGIFEPFPITEYRGSATMDYWDDIDACDKI